MSVRKLVKVWVGDELLYMRPERDHEFAVYRASTSSAVRVDGRFALVLADLLDGRSVQTHPYFDYFMAALDVLGIERKVFD